MKQSKTIYFLLLFTFFTIKGFQTFSQNIGHDNYTGLKIAHPPSPNAASLGNYADYNVSNFSGLSDITMPLYELTSDEISIPISLSYNPNQVKVNSLASWVGTGWSLNAGGVITRTVRGFGDDMNFTKKGLCNKGNWNIPTYSDEVYMHDKIPQIGTSNNCQTAYELRSLLIPYGACACDQNDTEPDIFYFNFMGKVGKFVLYKDYEVKLIPHNNLKIDVSYYLSGELSTELQYKKGWIKSFTITDEKGIKYIFDAFEYTYSNIDGQPMYTDGLFSGDLVGGNSTEFYYSSWYLSKIIPVNGREINFTYADESYDIINPPIYSFRNCPGNDCENDVLASLGTQTNNPQKSRVYRTSNIQGKRLSQINSANGRIEFAANTNRLDLNGSHNLSGVKVYNNNNELVRDIELEYTYKNCDQTEPNRLYGAGLESNPTENAVRLFLSSVKQRNVYNSQEYFYLYKFLYNDSYAMPKRGSFYQDFWGFTTFNNAKTLVPRLYVHPALGSHNKFRIFPFLGYQGQVFDLPGADRNCNPNHITTGMITRINFSTGGYTDFEFEANQFSFEGRDLHGGGVRIKKITTHDGVKSEGNIVKEYKYLDLTPAYTNQSSGKLLSLPFFAYQENTHAYTVYPNPGSIYVVQPNQFNTFDYNLYRYFLNRSIMPMETLNGYDGNNVVYSSVTEIQSGKGKSEYQFSVPAKYGDLNDDAAPGYGNCDIQENGYCDNLFQATPSYYCEALIFHPDCWPGNPVEKGNRNSDMNGMNLSANYSMPYAPNLNYDWNRGFLIAKSDYNQDGIKIRELKNEYFNFVNGTQPFYVHGLTYKETDNWKLDNNGSYTSNLYSGLCFFSKYKIITGIAKLIKKTTETVINPSDPNSSLSSFKEYTYKQNHILPADIKETNSNGKIHSSEFSFVGDMLSELPFAEMYSKNIISPVIRVRQLVNNVEIKNEKTTYSEWQTDKYNPIKVENSLNATPLNTVLDITQYDNIGNVIEMKDRDGIPQVFIRDYNNTNIICFVLGAYNAEVAYTSFEADSKGNWSFSGAPAISVTAPTGNKSYSLGNGNISKAGLSPMTYIISYWKRSGTVSVNGFTGISGRSVEGWTYYELRINNPASGIITISGTGEIDELRLYPEKAQMTTYTCNPLIGVTSQNDVNNRITYYRYDGFGRLILVYDQDKNILKKICYNYAGQVEDCTTDCPPNAPAVWQNTTSPLRCQQGSCGNTGYQEQEQQDVNPCSATYNQTQWIASVYNPTACPLSTCVNLTSTFINTVMSDYTATYTLNASPNTVYTFNVPAVSGLQALGTIPAGDYTLVISRTIGYPFIATFKSGCFKQTIRASSATFYNVPVSTITCKSISIDFTPE